MLAYQDSDKSIDTLVRNAHSHWHLLHHVVQCISEVFIMILLQVSLYDSSLSLTILKTDSMFSQTASNVEQKCYFGGSRMLSEQAYQPLIPPRGTPFTSTSHSVIGWVGGVHIRLWGRREFDEVFSCEEPRSTSVVCEIWLLRGRHMERSGFVVVTNEGKDIFVFWSWQRLAPHYCEPSLLPTSSSCSNFLRIVAIQVSLLRHLKTLDPPVARSINHSYQNGYTDIIVETDAVIPLTIVLLPVCSARRILCE